MLDLHVNTLEAHVKRERHRRDNRHGRHLRFCCLHDDVPGLTRLRNSLEADEAPTIRRSPEYTSTGRVHSARAGPIAET